MKKLSKEEIEAYNIQHQPKLMIEYLSQEVDYINQIQSVYRNMKDTDIEEAVREGINKAIYDFAQGIQNELTPNLVFTYCKNRVLGEKTSKQRLKKHAEQYITVVKSFQTSSSHDSECVDCYAKLEKLASISGGCNSLQYGDKCKSLVVSVKVLNLSHAESAKIFAFKSQVSARNRYKQCLDKIANQGFELRQK